jgi:CheY-like chemotaxis protein
MTQTTPPTHLVLYADDDPDDIKFVEDSFSETTENVELVTAYNGIDLIRYLESLNPLSFVETSSSETSRFCTADTSLFLRRAWIT